MTIHVVTPFSRVHNREKLTAHLAPFGIIWHPLIHEDVVFESLPWIQPMKIAVHGDWRGKGTECYNKMNQFIEAGLIDDDYYCVLCDDDTYGIGFFDIIRRYSGDVIVPSMYESKQGLLLAAPENMHPSSCSFQQLIIRGGLFKNFRYNNFCQSDGQMLEHICIHHPVRYAITALVLANSI